MKETLENKAKGNLQYDENRAHVETSKTKHLWNKCMTYLTAAAFSIPLFFGCGYDNHKIERKGETVRLNGTVVDERYMPASLFKDSRYSFGMNIESEETKVFGVEPKEGRIAFEVYSTKTAKKESIDAIITSGHKVSVLEVPYEAKNKQIIKIEAHWVKPHRSK